MANRGYDELDGRFSMGSGRHDTSHTRTATPKATVDVAGLTSVEEQFKNGGWTRTERPYGVSDDLPPDSQYRGGMAGSSGTHIVSDYPGRSTPQQGVTY